MNDELPFDELDRAVEEGLSACRGHVRSAAKNALLHLRRGWALREFDPEMAVFRGITAEEEAATALMICIAELRYPHAERLNRRDHVQKLGVYPFFLMINNHLAGLRGLPPSRLRVVELDEAPPKLVIEINTPRGWAQPVPPLNLSILEEEQSGPHYNFRREIEQFLERNGISDFRSHVKRIAQQRNLLLYASYEGVPGVVGDQTPWLLGARNRTMHILRVLCLVFPYREHQPFVRQALIAFLSAVQGLDYDTLVVD